jgi:hypothetical protein
MPDCQLFLESFNVVSGLCLGNYEVTSVDCRERSVVRFNTYRYDLTITATTTMGSAAKLARFLDLVYQQVSPTLVVRTPSGRPYACDFIYNEYDPPEAVHSRDYHRVTITFTGHAQRIKEADVAGY